MKKWIAMLLMVCLLAAAVPALGEEDYTGNWYMTVADVSLASMTLNADGSVEFNMAEQGTMNGTWTTGEGKITVTIDGDGLDFTYEDGKLTAAGFFPVPFVREEGKINSELIGKMMSGEAYDIPEGMTEEEMMEIAKNFVTEYQAILAEQAGDDTTETTTETTVETPVADAGEPVTEDAPLVVSILNENFLVYQVYGGLKGYYYAKIQNNTETPYFVNGGTFLLTDADGNAVGEELKYPNSRGSRYLEPGEISFISFRVDIPEDLENPNYYVVIKAEKDTYSSKDYAVTVSSTEIGTDRYGNPAMKAAITNTTDEFLPGINVIIAMEDAEGKVIWMREESLYNYELGPNSTIKLTGSIDSDALEYFTSAGIVPTTVEAYAYVEIND